MPNSKNLSNLSKISISLSGGGTRAMAFHAGVLLFLAEKNLLEKVHHISTVSGGSLITGLIIKEGNYNWPSSEQYKNHIFPSLKNKLCSRNLDIDAISMLKHPTNLKYIFSRANLLAKALYEKWGVSSMVKDLPDYPEWSINGTTAETGKRFRFKKNSIGDYTIGYSSPEDMLLADAMSISAAFPGLIGPYSLKAKNFTWLKREWGVDASMEKIVEINGNLRIYDGGVYDNLGLETFFDHGKSSAKDGYEFIICSDAGAPLKNGFSYFKLNPWRIKRVMDIMSDQSRALRIRSFINYLSLNKNSGLYIGITDTDLHSREDSNHPANYPTNLRKFTESEFDKISNFGAKVAQKNFKIFIR